MTVACARLWGWTKADVMKLTPDELQTMFEINAEFERRLEAERRRNAFHRPWPGASQ